MRSRLPSSHGSAPLSAQPLSSRSHRCPPRAIPFGNQGLARRPLHGSTRGTRVALFGRLSRNLRTGEGGEDMKLSSMIVAAMAATCVLAGQGLAQSPAKPQPSASPAKAAAETMKGQHSMDGEVTKVDAKQGWEGVKTPEGRRSEGGGVGEEG